MQSLWPSLLSLASCVGLTACASLGQPAPAAQPVRIYLLAGQSNMDGRGLGSELTGPLAKYAEPFEAVPIKYHNPDLPDRPGQGTRGWAPLEPGFSVPPGAYKGATFGPEIGFAHAYHAARPDTPLRLIKYSKGGTTLIGQWRPEDDDGLAAGMIEFVRQELASLRESGIDYELVGLLWHQGESDLGRERDNPGVYQQAMLHFVERLRTELDAPGLIVVLGEVYNATGQREPISQAIRSTAAADPRIGFAGAHDLTVSDPDNDMKGTHFDAASQIELGRRMAEVALELEAAADR